MKKKVCIVTGTRAEYGLLKPLIQKIQREEELELMLYVTGTHLSMDFGCTVQEIEHDKIPIKRRIEMLLSADSSSAVLKSMSVEMMGFADALNEDRPDIMVVLGDRYEILMAATAAMIFRIPIAHIHGGEITEGAVDDAFRHAITKMSRLHFAATEEYKNRIVQMGEDPKYVFNVGALGIENIKNVPGMSKEELEQSLGIKIREKVMLVTYHPVTMQKDSAEIQIQELLGALKNYSDFTIIFTGANADMEGKIINQIIEQFVKEQGNCAYYKSLGQKRYFSLIRLSKIVVGNSSSGIIEVPSFGVPTVNIGDRQKGRVCANSVISCGNTREEIQYAIDSVLSENFGKSEGNPYEGQDTSKQIVCTIKEFLKTGETSSKEFYDIKQ